MPMWSTPAASRTCSTWSATWASVARGGGLAGGRVGPPGVLLVGKRHVPHPELVEQAQHAERGGDRVAPLGAEQRGHPAAGADPLHIGRGEREFQRVRVAADHVPDEV